MKVKRDFSKLLSNAQATVRKISKNKTTSTIKGNNNKCHAEETSKTRNHCNMKYKNGRISCNNICCGHKGKGINNHPNSVSGNTGSSSYSQSFSLLCLSSYSPNSVITFITTTVSGGMRNVYHLFWPQQHQHQQIQQYKIKYKTSKHFLSAPSSTSSSTPASSSASPLKSNNFFSSLKWYFFLWLLLSLLAPCISLTMTEVRIPKHIMRHETASLGCKYDLDGESLYSVKWYKDGFEFYRYVPRDIPPGQVFPLPGVDVDLQNSTDNVVVLNSVTLQSTGRYRCEVSGEAPSFQTVSGHEDMIVVVTPLKGPQITGGQPRYSIGEKVSVNCTSAPSKPICHLSWLINGVHANRSYLRYYEPKIVGREGLEVATLGLEFRCVAKISSVYWQSNEESVESDKHQRIPVLESRETVVPKSRFLDKSLEENQKAAAKTSTSYKSSSNLNALSWLFYVIPTLCLAASNLSSS